MSDDDVVRRSEEFEQKLTDTASPEGIIDGLIAGLARNKKIVKWLTISIILDIIFSFTLAALTIFVYHNDKAVDEAARTACIQANKNSRVINEFLHLQIANTKSSSQRTEAEKKVTIDSYLDLIIRIPKCTLG